MFAVDQAVQRSADGGERTTIAKTVSLMLTPEQASKLTLAEQIGEISLIPRNPDDEEAADWSEYTVDDLLPNGEKNSREKEQGRNGKTQPSEPIASRWLVAERDQQHAHRRERAVPHGDRRSQDVREVLFDAETGRIDSDARRTTRASAGPTLRSIAQAAPQATTLPPSPATHAKMLDDFPINFDATQEIVPM